MRDPVFQLLNDLAVERTRQEEVEGFTLEHDDTHDFGELARAAAGYALAAAAQSVPANMTMHALCRERAKKVYPSAALGPMKDHPPRQAYIIACALLMAEIERIDRRDGRQTPLDRTDAQSRRFDRQRHHVSPAAQLTGQEATDGLGGPAAAGEPRVAVSKETPNA